MVRWYGDMTTVIEDVLVAHIFTYFLTLREGRRCIYFVLTLCCILHLMTLTYLLTHWLSFEVLLNLLQCRR